jgi:dTDP-4-amino-4,6-dideoxygalactose transaminase
MYPVTKPYLPKLENYSKYVNKAYELEWLTNRGTLVKDLENRIGRFLESRNNPLLMNNGTIPLQIAIKHLPRKSEIITTPFSYVATCSSILWEERLPVFVDIDQDYLTIDPQKIRNAITPNTSAILATHVFGNPCEIEAIEKIAKEHKLTVIYDAAHSFDVKYKGKSLFDYGDIATCSFHATKLFHTGEGGAVFINKTEWYDTVYQMHNFGHNGPFEYSVVGINGKMSELNAAMGHAVLDDFELIKAERKRICDYYFSAIQFGDGIKKMTIRKDTDWNNSYFPVIFKEKESVLKVVDSLNQLDIYPRRYFYPSLNTIGLFQNPQEMPVSEHIAERILCLPIFFGLEEQIMETITTIVNKYS